MRINKLANILLWAAWALCLSACTHVEPWQHGNLAKPHMALDYDSIKRAADAHVNSSREAMPSGSASEGGGCGCY